MKIHRGYKYRIYPARSQIVRLPQFFGCCRFVYNHFLALRTDTYASEKRNMSQYECMRLATELRDTLPWLADCDSMAIQEAIKDLNKAYVNFFEGRAKYPKFHKKSHDQSYRTRNQSNGIRIDGNYIVLPKIGTKKGITFETREEFFARTGTDYLPISEYKRYECFPHASAAAVDKAYTEFLSGGRADNASSALISQLPYMNKKDLLSTAENMGVQVSTALKKNDLVSMLTEVILSRAS